MRRPPCGMLLLAVALLAGCPPDRNAPTSALLAREGRIEVTGGRVWYRVVGDGPGTPLLVLHGGPGATSHYLVPLERLGEDRPVVFWDQLGCGRSDRPDDPSLWTRERFVDELEQVRAALGLEQVHIFGHSWGTMLAVEYLATRSPVGVRSLILSSPVISIPRWHDDAARLRAELPLPLQEVLNRHEQAGTTDAEEYQEATMEFYRRYVCRLDPWPEALELAFAEFGQEVYEKMWGPTEFNATGTLRDFDRTDALPAIAVPTLFTAGRHDEATPGATLSFSNLVPGSRIAIFEESSHTAMLEEPDRYVSVVGAFLRDVERRPRPTPPGG